MLNVHTRRHIRQLRKTIKRLHNEKRVHLAAAAYYGTIVESINLNNIEEKRE
uniref:Uncharacterized protein n=1 Tax=viral metagenome TaxID=1070528 RepID=A0A6M3LQI7_9ZZZZ